MAKAYNFMKDAERSVFVFGILVKIYAGTVETVWKTPTKYVELAEKWIYEHTRNATHPSIQMDAIGRITFNRQIDLSGIFDRIDIGSNLDKYNQIIANRDDAINDACFRLQQDKESFQDMIRGMYYTERFINNAPSIP